jgi:hypothetical protein
VGKLLNWTPVHISQIARGELGLLAAADEGHAEFDVEGCIVGCWPGQVWEGFWVLLGVYWTGEGFQGFRWDWIILSAGS